MLLAWALQIEREGLTRLATWHGKQSKNILLWLLGEDAGMATVHLEKGTTYVQLWRSVLERNAPRSLEALDRAMAPSPIGQGSALRPLNEDALSLVADAYREAAQTS
jgi:hypothetical protein